MASAFVEEATDEVVVELDDGGLELVLAQEAGDGASDRTIADNQRPLVIPVGVIGVREGGLLRKR